MQKGLTPRPDKNYTFQISGPGWAWVRNFDRLPYLLYAEQRRTWFGINHPASLPQKCEQNVLNNQHGDFCESGISACPESVGVGKFCRLRLRLRGKQPTPTDSDSGSDSDSAALAVGSMRLKAAGSGERNSFGVRPASVRLGICLGNKLSFENTPDAVYCS